MYRLFGLVEGKFILVIFGPASDRQSHTEWVKLEEFQSVKFGFKLLDGVVQLVEARVVDWLPVHFVDLNDKDFL